MNKKYLLIDATNQEFLVDSETGEIVLMSETGFSLEARDILDYFQLDYVAIDLI